MKDRLRTVLFVVALGMVGMNIYDTGFRLGNVLIAVMLVACFAVHFYTMKKRRETALLDAAEAAQKKRALRKARAAEKKKTPAAGRKRRP